MMKVMKYIFSNLMPNTQKIYVAFILIYQFLSERMKIEKIEKLVANFHVKTEYANHIRNLKQALNQGIVFKKDQRDIGSLNLIKSLG